MNRYEGLFILASSSAADDDGVKVIVERIEKLILQSNGKVENVQRLGVRPFARNLRQESSGYYVNILFRAPSRAIAELDGKLHLESSIARWQFTIAQPELKRPLRKPREDITEERGARA